MVNRGQSPGRVLNTMSRYSFGSATCLILLQDVRTRDPNKTYRPERPAQTVKTAETPHNPPPPRHTHPPSKENATHPGRESALNTAQQSNPYVLVKTFQKDVASGGGQTQKSNVTFSGNIFFLSWVHTTSIRILHPSDKWWCIYCGRYAEKYFQLEELTLHRRAGVTLKINTRHRCPTTPTSVPPV